MPVLAIRQTVGLIPTIPSVTAGQMIDPFVSVPTAAAPCAKSKCYPRAGIVVPKGCYPMALVFGYLVVGSIAS
jgi:hypothetical protein